MNENVIDINVSAKHMGVMLCTDKKSECIDLYSLFEVMIGENRQLMYLFI